MKRAKLVASLMMCVFCLSFLVVGVWAAVSTVNFNLSGQLTFNPEGVYVKVSGQMYRGENYGTLAPLTASNYILPEMTNYDEVDGVPAGNLPLSTWTAPDVTLVPGERAVKYRIEVTNVSEAGIKGVGEFTITGQSKPTPTTVGGVNTYEFTNYTVTEYAQYIQNIQPNDTQVYELVVELNDTATSATINVEISFDFTDETTYTMSGATKGFVNMGKYPQTYVGDTMNAELEAWYTNQPVAETYTAYKGRTTTSPYELNEPVVYNAYEYIDGNTYCQVPQADLYNSGTKTFNDGTTIVNGETYWFKIEPIQWRVLTENYTDTENTTPVSYLLSEYVLSANTTFNPSTSNTNHTYYSAETNALRPFLNEVFYSDAFTAEEKALIAQRTLTDADLDATSSYANDPDLTIASTEPLNVFASSYYDMINTDYGFNSSNGSNDQQRRASATDFAMVNYAYKSTSTSYQDIHGIGASYYWTSSAYSASTYAYSVGNRGSVLRDPVNFEYNAVRPALLFNLAG